MFGQFSIKILGKRDIEQCCVYKLQLSMEDEVCNTYVRMYGTNHTKLNVLRAYP